MPWGHNLVLLAELKTSEQRLACAQGGRGVRLVAPGAGNADRDRSIEREDRSLTNFAERLPAPFYDGAAGVHQLANVDALQKEMNEPLRASMPLSRRTCHRSTTP